jgi:hypothetical protein
VRSDFGGGGMKFYVAFNDKSGNVGIYEYKLVGETPKCWYVQHLWWHKPTRILKDARNSRFKWSKITALQLLIFRKQHYIDFLQRRIDTSRVAIRNAQYLIEEEEKK